MGSNASTTRGSKSGSDYTQALLDGARASGSGAVRASGSGVPPVVPAGGNEMGLSTAEVLRLQRLRLQKREEGSASGSEGSELELVPSAPSPR